MAGGGVHTAGDVVALGGVGVSRGYPDCKAESVNLVFVLSNEGSPAFVFSVSAFKTQIVLLLPLWTAS